MEAVDQIHRLSVKHYRQMGHAKEQPKQGEGVEPAIERFNVWEVASNFSTDVLRHSDELSDSA